MTLFSTLYRHLLLTLCILGFAATAAQAETPYRIVTTIGMVRDIAAEVAGPRAEVVNLIGSGIDPHLYKPTRSDIATLMSADVVLYNGLMLEGKMTDALIRVARSGKAVHAVTELVPESELLEPEDFQGHFDPHLWMNPRAWTKAVEAVRKVLSEFNPQHAAEYGERARAYSEKLAALDAYAEKSLHAVPKEARVLVTAHDAFNYFGRRYGYEVVGIQGLSTESEAGVRDIERIVDLLVDRKIRAVFVESTVSDRNMKALIAGAQARGHAVRIGGELFSDAMGKPGTYEGTYLGMIDHNVTTIAHALGAAVDPKGFQGKLAVP
jgi:manganese/zinc/iron transport system substrate-binding protein